MINSNPGAGFLRLNTTDILTQIILRGVVMHAYSPSYAGSWGRRKSWAQEVEAAVSRDHTTALQPGQHSKTLFQKTKKERKREQERKQEKDGRKELSLIWDLVLEWLFSLYKILVLPCV